VHIVVDALIFQKAPHGGIARLYRELLPQLCALDPELTVELFSDGPLRGALPQHARIRLRKLPPVHPTLRPQGRLRKLLYPLRRVAGRVWQKARQGYLGDGGGAIWHSTYFTLPGRWAGPQIVTVHDLVPENFPAFFDDPLEEAGRQQKRRCIEAADAIICVSEVTRRLVQAEYRPAVERLYTIHHAPGPAFRRLPPDPGSIFGAPPSPFLLYVGSRVHYKNFSTLLEAYAGWERRAQVPLVCVGSPWTEAELRRLRAFGVNGLVTQMSGVDDATLCRLYNRALALVFPSLEEGFGLPLVEAMACGCPIVASYIPSTLEVCADIPIYFDRIDAVACRAALEQARLEGRGSERARRGLAWVQRYSWEQTARLTLDVYRTACARRAERLGQSAAA
jgi:glycosyltransferase involved in cell wall biosynthesis